MIHLILLTSCGDIPVMVGQGRPFKIFLPLEWPPVWAVLPECSPDQAMTWPYASFSAAYPVVNKYILCLISNRNQIGAFAPAVFIVPIPILQIVVSFIAVALEPRPSVRAIEPQMFLCIYCILLTQCFVLFLAVRAINLVYHGPWPQFHGILIKTILPKGSMPLVFSIFEQQGTLPVMCVFCWF